MEKAGFRERLAYKFDNFMSGGARSLFLALIAVFLLGYILTGVIRLILAFSLAPEGKPPIAHGDSLWRIWLQMTDPGNMAQDNESSLALKLIAMTSGLFGIIFFSAVIAFITTQLDQKIQGLKKGRSRVLESDHVLILGWNEQVIEIIRELILANESEKDAAVVVMSELPKEEMDDYLNEHLPDRKTTRIMTRTGEISSTDALSRVAIVDCKSIILLPSCQPSASEEDKAHSDARVLKTFLAVEAASEKGKMAHVVTAVYNETNRSIIQNVGEGEVSLVDAEDMVAKIIVQTSRSEGLASVYSGLIGFDGCEFYLHRSDWQGARFEELAYRFSDGIPLGIRSADGRIVLNPDRKTELKEDDDIVILAEDDSSISYKNRPVCEARQYAPGKGRGKKGIEKELIIGWNRKGSVILQQYADYISENSVINIALVGENKEAADEIRKISKQNPGLTMNIYSINPLNISHLRKLEPWGYHNVIILNMPEGDPEKVDATTINILLLLRELLKEKPPKQGAAPVQIISEVMNSDNLELISRTGANDFIISNQMVSRILAQTAEEPDILHIYDELFEEEGSEIYLKPWEYYFETRPDTPLPFCDLIGAAQERSEICMGYRRASQALDSRANFGTILNPPKDALFPLEPGDKLIVMAEDEL